MLIGESILSAPLAESSFDVARTVQVEYASPYPLPGAAEGQRFAVLSRPEGEWAGHPHTWATLTAGGYVFETPEDGNETYCRATGEKYIYQARGGPGGHRLIGIDAALCASRPRLIVLSRDAALYSNDLRGQSIVILEGDLETVIIPSPADLAAIEPGRCDISSWVNQTARAVMVRVDGGEPIGDAPEMILAPGDTAIILAGAFNGAQKWVRIT
jgi:hypothetical protein